MPIVVVSAIIASMSDYKERLDNYNANLPEEERVEAPVNYLEIKQEEVAKKEEIEARMKERGREVELELDHARGVVLKDPIMLVLRQKKRYPGPTAWWFVKALSNISTSELLKLIKNNRDNFSVNEIAAIDLLLGVIKKDPTAVDRFWKLNAKIESNQPVVQVNNINANSEMKTVLDQIVQDAMPARVVDGSTALSGQEDTA